MSRYNSTYHIGQPGGQCAATGQPIEPGQPFIAVLCECEDSDEFQRLDFLPDAWESHPLPEGLFSYWRTTMPDPEDQRGALVDNDTLVNLFERLDPDDDRPIRLAYRYVIGLILIRKRLLKHVGQEQEDGRNIWLVRHKGDPPESPSLRMVDPDLSETHMREVADQLGEVLRGDL